MPFMLKQSLTTLFILITLLSFSQTGGNSSFQSLNYFYSARQLGLSGNVIGTRDKDLNTLYGNPASLNAKMMKRGSFSENIRTGNVNAGSLNYGRAFGNITAAAHFRYLSYGYQRRTDYNGVDLGSFSPGDFILGASASKLINPRMSIGATFNILYSQLDSYTAFGNSIDIGGQYFNEEKELVLSGVVKNLGIQWKSYAGNKSPMPLEVQLGISKKLAHAPFRFHLTAQHLQQWDLSYRDPNAKDRIDPLTGDTIKVKKASFIEKVARHGLLQTEFLFGEKVTLNIGLDIQRRLELRVANRPGLAGFAFGIGFHLKRFTFEYGWMIYSVAGSQHGVTFSLPIGQK